MLFKSKLKEMRYENGFMGSEIENKNNKEPNHFNKMPIYSLEDKKEILWNAKIRWKAEGCRKGHRNAAKDSKKNKTDNHMKEV